MSVFKAKGGGKRGGNTKGREMLKVRGGHGEPATGICQERGRREEEEEDGGSAIMLTRKTGWGRLRGGDNGRS